MAHALALALWGVARLAWCDGGCRRFIMISMQRSGSRYVTHMLSSHPSVYASGELFADAKYRYDRFKEMKFAIEADAAVHCNVKKGQTTVGFKWMSNQGHNELHAPVKSYLLKKDIRLIYLWRRNVLRQLISNRANKLNKRHQLQPTKSS